jgi:DNA-binding response OmpR family regulator
MRLNLEFSAVRYIKMKSEIRSILCVDENKDNLELLKITFEQEGFAVTICQSLEECLTKARENDFSAIILDNRLGDRTSLDVCREISEFSPDTPIIFCSGEARNAEIAKAIEAGGDQYFVKPVDFDKLAKAVKELIKGAQSA